MRTPQLVLIDWDFGAHGIWKILSPAEMAAPPPPGRSGPAPAQITRPRPWRDLLSSALLEALQEWNDTGEMLLGGRRRSLASESEMAGFYARAAELGQRSQQELGTDHAVLYIPNGA